MAEFVDFKKDGVWEHFLREKGGNSAKCKLCSTILKATGGSTKGLHKHLKRIHSINVLKRQATDDDAEPSTSTGVRASATTATVLRHCSCIHLCIPGIPGNDIFPFPIPGNKKPISGMKSLSPMRGKYFTFCRNRISSNYNGLIFDRNRMWLYTHNQLIKMNNACGCFSHQ